MSCHGRQQKALVHELEMLGIGTESEVPLKVSYKGQVVGEFRADIVLENTVLIELKALRTLHPACEAQVINYLKAHDSRSDCLLISQGPKRRSSVWYF